ncbi:MAG: hypothetical protein [Microvirus sp.]|nr:MAG: hypothetical protein [Microvirus sp.]
MSKRVKMGRKKSKRLFKKTAQYINPRNIHAMPMRGGFRL